ncbi:MAG TPA: hypothetical protein VG795_13015 [Acidimicrobiia bacterium]|nr:hypothetical protein [Acidimicrobiia bacterium]
MRSTRQRLAAVTLLGGLTTVGLGLSAGPASGAVDDCLGIIGKAASSTVSITTTPAAGSDVAPGSQIAIDASWDAAAFEETDRLFVCGTVNGEFVEAMSSQHKSLDNDGAYSAASTVPADAEPGAEVCVLGAVKGQPVDDDPSQVLASESRCFRVAAAVEPQVETTTTTAAPVVDPVVVEAGTPAAPAVEAAPAPVEAPAPLPELPRTGSGIGLLAGFGSITLAVGGLARFLGRRRPADG